MVAGSRTLTTLLFALAALMTVSFAQESGEACSSRDTVYPIVKTAILAEASYKVERARYATPGERLDVIGSKRFGPWCWLQVSDGWIIDSPRALSSEPPDSATGSGSATGRSCYRAARAFIIGNMNIRDGASTSTKVVAKARAGDVFMVSDSALGANWCWLKISQGWLANTSRVRSKKPALTVGTGITSAPATQQSDVDNCCFVDRPCTTDDEWVSGYWAYQKNRCGALGQPAAITAVRPLIEGSASFVRRIETTLEYLSAHSPTWYAYVVGGTDRITEFSDGVEGNCLAQAAGGHTQLEPCIPYFGTTYELQLFHTAAVLAHEACHTYQQRSGRHYAAKDVEPPCQQAARDTIEALDTERKYTYWYS